MGNQICPEKTPENNASKSLKAHQVHQKTDFSTLTTVWMMQKKRARNLMLLYNDDLMEAYYLKETFFEIC